MSVKKIHEETNAGETKNPVPRGDRVLKRVTKIATKDDRNEMIC